MTKPMQLSILIVDDDEDDIFFATRALQRSDLPCTVKSVSNGVEMMDYLRREGDFRGDTAPLPDLILLDLNMPKKNGKEALAELRADSRLCHIPVVLFTTSSAEQDIVSCYRLGANSYIRKPVTFDQMVESMDTLKKYWAEHVTLPGKRPLTD